MADYRYLIVGGGMTADAACSWDPRPRRRTARSVSSPPRRIRPTRARRSRRRSGRARTRARSGAGRPSSASTSTRACAIVSLDLDATDGHRRRGRDARVRATAARDGRYAAATPCGRRRGRHLLPHARRLPPLHELAGDGVRVDGHRRRLHRLGDRGRARIERLRGDDRLSRERDRSSPLPGGALDAS